MAQFYAEIQGNRGQTSRTGTKASGLSGHIRGWDLGARIEMEHTNGRDVCTVYLTGGSNGGRQDQLVGTFTSNCMERVKS